MWMKVVKVGLIAGVVGIVVNVILQMLTEGITQPLFLASAMVWKSMMSPEVTLMYLTPLWVGVFMALVYSLMDKKHVIAKTWWMFGLMVWLLAGFPGMLMTYSSMAVPNALVGLWMITGMIEYLAMGWVVVKKRP